MFFVAAVAVAIACVFLIPRTRINTDMTRYLPDDSPMKQGIEQMAEEFGEDGVGASMVRVMFWSLPDSLRAATKDELSTMDGISNVMYQDGSEEYNQGEKVLYELLCSNQRSQQDLAKEITGKYGSSIVIETGEQDTTALIGVILIAFALLLIVLFIMCESWLEPPIFLVGIGVAVAINMGTNALLNSVSGRGEFQSLRFCSEALLSFSNSRLWRSTSISTWRKCMSTRACRGPPSYSTPRS